VFYLFFLLKDDNKYLGLFNELFFLGLKSLEVLDDIILLRDFILFVTDGTAVTN